MGISIIVAILFSWITAPGYQPAGFQNGVYVGTHATAQAHALRGR